jgi:hypothetical protein
MAKINEYLNNLQELQNALKAQTVDYKPTSQDEYLTNFQNALRPGYDLAIDKRQKQTDTNKAELDVDAASRGMGASTWVSDVKNRQNQYENDDISTMESQYSAAIAQQLMNALQNEKSNQLSADQFNAGMLANRDSNAMGLAGNFMKATSSGGGDKFSYGKLTTRGRQVYDSAKILGAQASPDRAIDYVTNNIDKGYLDEEEAAKILVDLGLYK